MKKQIVENWKAIEKVEKDVQEKTGDPEAAFNATTFFVGGGGGRHLMLPCLYRGKKGRKGQKEFTNSYKEMMVFANYCPFTGKPLYEESPDEVKHTIHFGKTASFVVSEWLYNYFNSVKNDAVKYNELHSILSGVKYSIDKTENHA